MPKPSGMLSSSEASFNYKHVHLNMGRHCNKIMHLFSVRLYNASLSNVLKCPRLQAFDLTL